MEFDFKPGELASHILLFTTLQSLLYTQVYRFMHGNVTTYHDISARLVHSKTHQNGITGEDKLWSFYSRKTNILWYKLFQALNGVNQGWLNVGEVLWPFLNKEKVRFMMAPSKTCGVCEKKFGWYVYPTMMMSTTTKLGTTTTTTFDMKACCTVSCVTIAKLRSI